MSMRAFFRECRRPREFRIESRIEFRKRMDDRLGPVMPNDLNRCDSAGSVSVNELLGRFLRTFSVNCRDTKGKSTRAEKGEDGYASHANVLLQGTCQVVTANSFSPE